MKFLFAIIAVVRATQPVYSTNGNGIYDVDSSGEIALTTFKERGERPFEILRANRNPAIATVSGSMGPETISIKNPGEGLWEVSNNEASITVNQSKRIILTLKNPLHYLLTVRGQFENVQDVANAILRDFPNIVAAMNSFDPNMGDQTVGDDKVSADRNFVVNGGVEYVAKSKGKSTQPQIGNSLTLDADVLEKRINFSFDCVSDRRPINYYNFQKSENVPSVTVDDTRTEPRIGDLPVDDPVYQDGFREAQEAATKHCQSVYKLLMSAPSLRKAVLGLDH
jgi:hypothetical protein